MQNVCRWKQQLSWEDLNAYFRSSKIIIYYSFHKVGKKGCAGQRISLECGVG